MTTASTTILLVGSDAALLEGLSQSLAALGYVPKVATGMHEASDCAAADPPLVVVVSSELAADVGADVLRIPLAAGGALVLFHDAGRGPVILSPTLQRAVLADLALPLERHRLVALVQHVLHRSRTTGRRRLADTPPEQIAP